MSVVVDGFTIRPSASSDHEVAMVLAPSLPRSLPSSWNSRKALSFCSAAQRPMISCVMCLPSPVRHDLAIAVFDLHDVAFDGGRGCLAQPRIHARAGLLRGHERIDDDLVVLDLPRSRDHIAAVRTFEGSVVE